MIGGWSFLLLWLGLVLAAFGLPLGCVGLILLLCERSWQKPAGAMGSIGMLLVASILCLPTVVVLLWALIDNLATTGKLF